MFAKYKILSVSSCFTMCFSITNFSVVCPRPQRQHNGFPNLFRDSYNVGDTVQYLCRIGKQNKVDYFICNRYARRKIELTLLRPSNSSSRVSRIPHALIGATHLIAARHVVLALKARCHAVEVCWLVAFRCFSSNS